MAIRKTPVTRTLRLAVEQLEDRLVLNSQWGIDGPPLALNTTNVSASTLSVSTNALASGSASITSKNEVDYFKFTAPTTGFYTLTVNGAFDSMIAVYSSGSSGKLLGYADDNSSGTEQFKVYLESGSTYFMGITNYKTVNRGNYSWTIDATAASNPSVNNDARILYVNFDGAQLAASDLQTWDNDWYYGSAGEFDPNGDGVSIQAFLASNANRETIISNIMSNLQADLGGFGIKVVRLAAGSSAVAGDGATTIFVGPSTLEDLAANNPQRSLFHVACDIDVGNNNATDIAFVYDEDWGSVSATSLAMSDVILHETGHTLGLFHVHSGNSLETMGRRYSTTQRNWVVNTSFLNQSFYLREFNGSQDTYQEVALAFGVRSDLPTVPSDVSLASLRREEFALFNPAGGDFDHDHAYHIKSGIPAFEGDEPFVTAHEVQTPANSLFEVWEASAPIAPEIVGAAAPVDRAVQVSFVPPVLAPGSTPVLATHLFYLQEPQALSQRQETQLAHRMQLNAAEAFGADAVSNRATAVDFMHLLPEVNGLVDSLSDAVPSEAPRLTPSMRKGSPSAKAPIES